MPRRKSTATANPLQNHTGGDDLQLIYILLDELIDKFLDGNPKLHDIGTVTEAIQRYGFRDPMSYDKNLNDGKGGIVEGNGRLEILFSIRELNMDPPRGVKLDEQDRWCVPVIFGCDAINESEARAYSLDHNTTVMMGGSFTALDMSRLYDPKHYMDFLEELHTANALPLTVDGEDYEHLMQFLRPEEPTEESVNSDDDQASDLAGQAEAGTIESRVKPGEIWQLGRHRIACADCTEASNVQALFDGRIAYLVHADPPYGMGKEKDGVANDNIYGEKLNEFQMSWWNACRPLVADNGSGYIWGNPENLWSLWLVGGLKDSEPLTLRNQIIWDKKSIPGMKSAERRMYSQVTEHCLFFMIGVQGFDTDSCNYWEGWEPIRAYLAAELEKVADLKWADEVTGTNMAKHWFTKSQWCFPTKEHYETLQKAANRQALTEDYSVLKTSYERLKIQYDKLKRRFYKTRCYFDNQHDIMTDVWDFSRVLNEDRLGHATPKPVEMIARILKSSSPDEALIYAPFLGTGPEIIAAEELSGDRAVFGFELQPKYCEVIIQRWEILTEEKAECIGTIPSD